MTIAESQEPPRETWASGAAYERYVGRWSRLVAREFLHWLNVPAGGYWLDVGCGTGALSQTILDLAAPGGVHGIDRSEDQIAFSREHIRDERVQFDVGDGLELPVQTENYHAVVSGLVLNFVPDSRRAIAEMARAAKIDGTVAVYVWDYAGKMDLMRHFWDGAAALDPAALELDEGRRFPICHPDSLRELFQGAGLRDVEVGSIEIATNFHDFDDYWSPFLGGQGPAPGYARSLSDERRSALREHIRAGLPYAPDGSIRMIARAWAVQGVRN